MRVLEDKTNEPALNARVFEHEKYTTLPLDWGVMFLDESGGEMCREMGKHHGFNDLESARKWVKDNTHRAHSAITAFYVFAW